VTGADGAAAIGGAGSPGSFRAGSPGGRRGRCSRRQLRASRASAGLRAGNWRVKLGQQVLQGHVDPQATDPVAVEVIDDRVGDADAAPGGGNARELADVHADEVRLDRSLTVVDEHVLELRTRVKGDLMHESDHLLDGVGPGRLLRRSDDGRLNVIGEEPREVGSSHKRIDVCLERRAYFDSGHVVLRGDEHLVGADASCRRPPRRPTSHSCAGGSSRSASGGGRRSPSPGPSTLLPCAIAASGERARKL